MKRFTTWSLRWKIAASYAALLVIVLSTTSAVVAWRFGSIIYARVQDRADATMQEVLAVANPGPAPLGLQDTSPSPLQVLLNGDNLVYWSSPETSIEIDTPAGYPMVKSANLGQGRIPPAEVNAAHPVVFRRLQIRGDPAIVEDRFVRIGTTGVVIAVAQSLATVVRAVDEARRTVVVMLLVAIVAVILLSALLAAQATNPIKELSRAMREAGSERLDTRLNWPRHDEIGELAESFDDLLSRLEAAFIRERQFISDASHELRTPLTSINANAQMLLRWADRDEGVRRDSLETIARESASLGEMLNGMLTLAKADRGDQIPKEPVSLIEEARAVVRNAAPRAQEKGLTLSFESEADSALVLADAHLIRQMIGNLVDNALKFTERGGVEVRVGTEDYRAWIEVRDSGTGIAEHDLSRIFERFYRADRARSRSVPGTGLGLAIVRSIARVHGGSVAAERAAGGGTFFRVTIPLLADSRLTDLS
ncbi:MAG TPA: HAMP domain-containing sensor histidine kinase [Candidatus Tyrphobacter sp.]